MELAFAAIEREKRREMLKAIGASIFVILHIKCTKKKG
jgi:hypothetical protein